jgi:ABC-2 type transport system ATP-binding protein
MTTTLRIENLHKSFKTGFLLKRKKILKGISLSVDRGEIFGYLGPNGAGKTTTLKCVLGLIFPEEGKIDLFGRPHLETAGKARTGFLPENPYFYDYLTASEFLRFYSQLFLIPSDQREERIESLLRLVDMKRAENLQLRKYSRGMLQRIGLAQALLNNPDLVLLDEPLGGLDPLGRKEFRDIIVRLKEEGKTVFLSSHILQDIEMICDRVAILVDGRIISQGNLQELISQKVLFTEIVLSGLTDKDLEGHGEFVTTHAGRTLLKVFDEDKVDRIIGIIRDKRGRIHSLTPRTETLEDLFVDMVKKE